ncbi:MarR family winged helix-turn-helix transcriptional regulator [Actinocrispum wychmicini]|uniref:MarR family winged helix-turn-helix transcriptional regulator n=1 Tax=Actinocrispum wychmicini TaxID=1213861 RepID=UPI00140454BE|nr:MarR family transcriptional regulator [Actinocrispum wychmicini]
MAPTPGNRRPLYESPAFRLTVLGIHLASDFAEHLQAAGLTPKHVGMLTVIEQGLARTQDDVARLMRVSPSMIVRIADHLEQSDLIVRRRDPENRRKHVLSLTAQGKAVLGKTADFAATLDAALAARLGPDLGQGLDQALAVLMGRLTEGQ